VHLLSLVPESFQAYSQDRAKGEVESALQRAKTVPGKLAALLSGQQLPAAVALASASGDVRLATLMCQVACSSLRSC
jgi:hypothetical protein